MNLRALRVERGLSLDELGRRAGIERSRLSRAERGYAQLTEAEMERLASILRAGLETLTKPTSDQVD